MGSEWGHMWLRGDGSSLRASLVLAGWEPQSWGGGPLS